MIRLLLLLIASAVLVACKNEDEYIKPTIEPISESIYASGFVKSKNQYQVFSAVNGIIDSVFVTEGDSVEIGSALISISNDAQRLSKENAELAAAFSDITANQGKLNEAKRVIELSRNKMKNDSALYFRQKSLWEQKIGSKVEFERSELNYQNSKNIYYASSENYSDLKRQLDFTSAQSKKNVLISSRVQNDYTVRSQVKGVVYSLTKLKGELVVAQTPLAVIGDAKEFILEMQVDEYDILKINKGLTVLVTLDSYKGRVFKARVTKIDPLMNERSKTFMVEAAFIEPPDVLYPNISFEANIVLNSKAKAMLIPRNYLLNDSLVIKENGDTVRVKTGLKDYQKVEVISGISREDELVKP
jgi:multidrug efflux pump subunit AcrA (membrane-fusion protein)